MTSSPVIAAPSASNRPSIASSLITRPRPEPNAMRTASSRRRRASRASRRLATLAQLTNRMMAEIAASAPSPPRTTHEPVVVANRRRQVRGPSQPTRPAAMFLRPEREAWRRRRRQRVADAGPQPGDEVHVLRVAHGGTDQGPRIDATNPTPVNPAGAIPMIGMGGRRSLSTCQVGIAP